MRHNMIFYTSIYRGCAHENLQFDANVKMRIKQSTWTLTARFILWDATWWCCLFVWCNYLDQWEPHNNLQIVPENALQLLYKWTPNFKDVRHIYRVKRPKYCQKQPKKLSRMFRNHPKFFWSHFYPHRHHGPDRTPRDREGVYTRKELSPFLSEGNKTMFAWWSSRCQGHITIMSFPTDEMRTPTTFIIVSLHSPSIPCSWRLDVTTTWQQNLDHKKSNT